VILDGSKALRKAVRETFGEMALVQRCQIPQAAERPRSSPGPPAAVGEGDSATRLPERQVTRRGIVLGIGSGYECFTEEEQMRKMTRFATGGARP
jgi:hypothetical protein